VECVWGGDLKLSLSSDSHVSGLCMRILVTFTQLLLSAVWSVCK
jgi:hypothetical protein